MQTNVSPDRTASKGAVRSGLILLVRTDVYYLPLLHRSGYANKCEPWSDRFKGSSPVWAHISCKNSCLLSTPASHVRVCKQMWALIGLLQRERSGLGSYCLHYGLHKNIGVQFDFVCSIVFLVRVIITRNSGKCLKRACLSLVILQGSGHPGRVDYDQSPYKAMFNWTNCFLKLYVFTFVSQRGRARVKQFYESQILPKCPSMFYVYVRRKYENSTCKGAIENV